MTYGLNVYNSSGVQTVNDVTTVTRIISTFSISAGGAASGSTNIPQLSGAGRPWVSAYRSSTSPIEYISPNFTVAGTTVSWNYGSAPSSNRCAMKVFVGVY